MSSVVNVSPVGPDGVVRCQCDKPAAEHTSRTQANPDRKFYRCTNGQCGFWKWADQIMSTPTPQNTPNNSLKRPNSDDSGTQDTPSKRSRFSNAQILPGTPSRTPQQLREKRLAAIEEALSQQEQPVTPSRTLDQRQRCMRDIETAGTQSTTSSQASGEFTFTPFKSDRRTQGFSTQQKIKTEEFDRTLNEEEDPFAPNPGGLSSMSQTSSNIIPTDETILLVQEFEKRYIAETLKNARLEVKIRSLEKRIKELCRGGSE